MKNKITKAIFAFAILILGVFSGVSKAEAFVSWNTDPQESNLGITLVRVSNYTQNPGCSTCWSDYVNANPGDVISVNFYYHNTGDQTASNVSFRLSPQSSNSSSTTFNGILSWSGGSISDNASVTINGGAQSLTFIPGSVKYYPNQTTSPTSLPFGQNGSELFSGGFTVGSVAPGWASQGNISAQFRVGSTPVQQANLPIVTTQNATNVGTNSATLNGLVNPNGSVSNGFFKWGTSYGSLNQTLNVSGGINSVTPISGSIFGLSPGNTYYFQACATNTGGTACGSTLSFTTNGSTQSFVPTATTLSANPVSSNTATLNGNFSDNGSGDPTVAWFEYGVTTSLGSSTPQIMQGGSSGSFNHYLSSLSSNTTYYFKACASNVNGSDCGSILSFTTNSSGGSNNDPDITTVDASDIECTSARLEGFYDSNGSYTTTWFEYGTTTSMNDETSHVGRGTGSNDFSQNVSGLDEDETYYFRAVAQNQYGTVYGSRMDFETDCGGNGDGPEVTTRSATDVDNNSATLNGYVDPNSECTDYWFEWGTSSGNLSRSTSSKSAGCGDSRKSVDEDISGLNSNTTYYFRIVGENDDDTDYGSVLSFYTGNNDQTNLQVATTTATAIGRTSARLNGYVSGNSNGSGTVWFQWGTNQNLGFETARQNAYSSSQAFSTPLFGLTSGTTYYFRAVAEDGNGIVYGSIVPFTTLLPSSTVVVTSTGTGKPLMELTITTPFANVAPCERIQYTVDYRNISGSTLRKTTLNVLLPNEVDFTQASTGIFSDSDHSLIQSIGTLLKNDSGQVIVQGKVNCGAKDNDLLVATATMVFTTPAGAQDDAIAYATTTVTRDANFLAGLALFGTGFFPDTLLGWLLLILAIALVIALARRLYGKREPS